jgi:two-component system, cell cycle sensor histidine kinase and response regulator CckA
MLTYLGQTAGKHVPLDLIEVCRQSLPLLQAAAPQGPTLSMSLQSPGPTVCANFNHVQQIVTNLVTNAREAINENKGTVSLTVKTVSSMDISASHRFPIDWQPKNLVFACLEVTDTGCGIEDEYIDNIFDPFFSSKFTGRGLGLPVVLGLVRALNGVVTVESEVGRGSSFRVFLPVSIEEVHGLPAKAPQTLSREGSGTVLLVEDEEILCKMTATMLRNFGYKVFTAKDGVEALEVFKNHLDEIDVVLSDLSMPRMGGWETLTALRQIRPDIQVVLASGYDESTVLAGVHPELPQVFLHKPFRKEELRNVIARVMGAAKLD